MNCTMCDAAIPEDARFCIICGAPVTPVQTGPTQKLTHIHDWAIDPAMVTSTLSLPGYRLTCHTASRKALSASPGCTPSVQAHRNAARNASPEATALAKSTAGGFAL